MTLLLFAHTAEACGNGTDLRQQTTPLSDQDTADVPSFEVCPEGGRLAATLAFEGLSFEESEPLE